MGNCICIIHESQTQWGGEDWKPVLINKEEKSAMKMEEKKLKISKIGGNSTTKIKEVKVKVTKKQLERLLGKINEEQKGLSIEQVLGQLVKVSVNCETRYRCWKPMLQSIPEVN